MEEDGECARATKSGWWFPHRVYSPKAYPRRNGKYGNCDFNRRFDTNLNGIFDEVEGNSERAIAVCDQNIPLEECFKRTVTDGFHDKYEFKGTIIKLAKTKMFLGRRSNK